MLVNEEKNETIKKDNEYSNKTKNCSIEVQTQQKFKRLYNKLGYDSNEAKLKQMTISQQKASIERCHLLYEKGKIKNEVQKLMFVKNNDFKEKKELSECTFKPRTNSANLLLIKKDFSKIEENEKNMYDRSLNWKKKTSDKYKYLIFRIHREKIIQNKTKEECSFKPQVYLNLKISSIQLI